MEPGAPPCVAVGQASCPTLPTYPLLYSPDLTLQVRVSCLLTWCCVVGKEVGGGPHAQPQRSRYKPGVEDLGQAVGQLGALEKNLGSQGWLEYLPACRLATVRAAPRVQTGKLRRQPDRGWGRAALVPGTRPWSTLPLRHPPLPVAGATRLLHLPRTSSNLGA